MKKFVLLLTLIPMLSWAFPVYTNRLDFYPAQSTGAFDDFLWRWSGFDDQRIELLFRGISSPSNVGFRLAYPQRGKTFLDVLPPSIPTPTNVLTETVTPWQITYNFRPLYPTVNTPAFSNVVYRDNLLLTVDGAVALSNRITTITSPSTITQLVGSVIVTGRVGQITSNLYVAATSIVASVTNAFVPAPEYLLHTNITLATTATVSMITSREYIRVATIGGTNYYSSGTNAIFNGSFDASISGWSGFDGSGNSTTNAFWSGGQANIRATGTLQQIVSDLNTTSTYLFSFKYSALGANTLFYRFNNNSFSVNGSSSISTTFTPSASSFIVAFTVSNQTGVAGTLDDIVLRPVITNQYIDATSITTNTTSQSTLVQYHTPASGITNVSYKVVTNNYFYTIFSVPRTNIPPDGPYFAEVLTYTSGGITNPGQSRTLAKGQVTIENSIWGITNYAGYTNYPGPWSYLLQDGSRPMTGNLNLGGYSATNISTLVFTNGSSITIDDVATWNSFISSTSGLNAGTVFGGQVTGTYNNLNVRKDALDNMEYLDLATSPTGAVAAGRAVWSTGRSTAQLGLNANVNLDVGQQLMLYAKNDDTNTLAKGEVVIVSGASGDNPTIKRASNTSEALSARTIGIMAESVAVNGSGFVVTRGTIYGLNTTNFTQGAGLYLGANGTLQTNLPVAPTHGVFVGTVERVHQNAGQIYVAIQNYQEVEELSDVNVSSRATNDFLMWNGTVWTNYSRTNLALQSSLSGYLSLTGGAMNGNINMNGLGFTNVNIIQGEDSPSHINIPPTSQGEFIGPWTFAEQPNIIGYQTITGSVNAANLTNLSEIAGNGLDVSAGKLVVTSSAANASTWSEYPATQAVNIAANNITNISRLAFTTNGTASLAPSLYVSGTTLSFYPSLAGSPATVYHSGNLNLFSYLTISQGNTNYWRITTAPATSTASGSRGQIAVSSSNVFLYNPDALGTGTARWIRISGDINW